MNVRCLFEGEEEIGSPHLEPVLRAAAGSGVDAAVISDTRMLGPRRPALIVGLRGSLAAELEVTGPGQDLHSGAFGGAVHNPAHVLCQLVASLHDDLGRVAVDGFYRRVRPVRRGRASGPERVASAAVLRAAGGQTAFGEGGYTPYEQTTLRPALDVSGLHAGHTAAGVKSIVPARARAKLTLRLAADQDPTEIGELLRAHIARRAPTSTRVHVKHCQGSLSGEDRSLLARGPSRRARPARGLRGEPGGAVLRRDHPGCRAPRCPTRNPHCTDGVCPTRRWDACSERARRPRGAGFRYARVYPLPGNTGIDRAAATTGLRRPARVAVIIDFHCHAGQAELLTAPWTTDAPLGRYLHRARAAHIDHTVIMPTFPGDSSAANRAIAALVRRDPKRLTGLAWVHPRRDRGRVGALARKPWHSV